MARTHSLSSSSSSIYTLQTQKSFKKNWLSDPSTYPLIVIMGTALTFMVGMSANALLNYKDVRVNPARRNQKMQTWGQEDTPHLLSRAVYWNSWQKNAPEGLGVDHNKWLEEKKSKDPQ
jgi:hypothetical protein